jgi:fucose 4-O-acetylase-like acetyltransferase
MFAWRRLWALTSPLHELVTTLGRRSLAAFVLHVYGLIVLAHLPIGDQLWTNTLVQFLLIGVIAAALKDTAPSPVPTGSLAPAAQPIPT